MTKKHRYRQCECAQESGRHQVAWLPEISAKKGNILDLFDERSGEWTEGWTVLSVGTTAKEYDWVIDQRGRKQFGSLDKV